VVYVAALAIAYLIFRRKPKEIHAYVALAIILIQFAYKNLLLLIFHIPVI